MLIFHTCSFCIQPYVMLNVITSMLPVKNVMPLALLLCVCVCILFHLQFIHAYVCVCMCVPQAPSPVNPSALDRTAAWLMNVPYIEQESEAELCRDEHTQAEKVTDRPHTIAADISAHANTLWKGNESSSCTNFTQTGGFSQCQQSSIQLGVFACRLKVEMCRFFMLNSQFNEQRL